LLVQKSQSPGKVDLKARASKYYLYSPNTSPLPHNDTQYSTSSQSLVDGSNPGTPQDSSLAGSGDDEMYEDSINVGDDDDYQYEAMESMPERIPKIKR